MIKSKKVLVACGDPSGDAYLAELVKELNKKVGSRVQFVGLCGPKSKAAGVQQLFDQKEVAVVGLVEVLSNIKQIALVLKKMSEQLKTADALLCVDFPDFNFRLAARAKRLGKAVDYFIAPQSWAWRSGRAEQMKKWLRKLYVALPFEESYFKDRGLNASYNGHPLRDQLKPNRRAQMRENFALSEDDFALALLPGSRSGELSRHLPLLLQAWKNFEQNLKTYPHLRKKNYKVIMPLTSSWTAEILKNILDKKHAEVLDSYLQSKTWQITNDSHGVMMASDFAWIASGTATLEAAYYQLPHILFYKLNAFSAFLLKRLTGYFNLQKSYGAGLPNILLQERVIPELLQDSLTPERLAIESLELLGNKERFDIMKKKLRFIPKKMGQANVCERIAEDYLKVLGIEN